MWYVMQVRTGTEENIRCQCQRLINSDILERCFIPYYQQKKRFQGEWHIQERILVEMSCGIIENDRVQIVSGPLTGMEGSIRRIDRHKRIAHLEIEMFGRTVEMKVGLEIIKKE